MSEEQLQNLQDLLLSGRDDQDKLTRPPVNEVKGVTEASFPFMAQVSR
ncbi:hypothetical protein [Azospirillum baldaniorum]|nr:hypothetical protein [Azospirillum baldaniorum]